MTFQGFSQAANQNNNEDTPTMSFAQFRQQHTSGRAFFNKTTQPGATITGTVTNAIVKQAHDFGSNRPKMSRKGNPMYDLIITLDTTLHEDQDDNGKRTIYVHCWGVQLDAMTKACQQAGVQQPTVGDRFTATYKGQEPGQDGLSGAKLYEYTIQHEQNTTSVTPQQVSTNSTNGSTSNVDVNTIKQLYAIGKSVEDISKLLNTDMQVVRTIVEPSTADEPDF